MRLGNRLKRGRIELTRRASFNEVIPGKLYQRGRFLSWPRKKKDQMLEDHKIRVVVNLWSKVDPEVSGDSDRIYIHLPMKGNKPLDEIVLEKLIPFLASFILWNNAVLVHCEAGVNRSCYLTACLVANYEGISGEEALKIVEETCGKVKLNKNLRQALLDREVE